MSTCAQNTPTHSTQQFELGDLSGKNEPALVVPEETKTNQFIIMFNLDEHKDKHERKTFRAAKYNSKVAVCFLMLDTLQNVTLYIGLLFFFSSVIEVVI